MSSAPTCKTCKHWDIANAGPRRTVACRGWEDEQSEPEPVSEPWSECKRIARGFDEDPDWTKERAAVWDGSEYYATLETRGDFGCVLWEVRHE